MANYMTEMELRNLYGDPSQIDPRYLDQLVQEGRLGYVPGEEAIDPGMDQDPGMYYTKLDDGRVMNVFNAGGNWIIGEPRVPTKRGGLGHFLRNFVLPAATMGAASMAGIGQGVAGGMTGAEQAAAAAQSGMYGAPAAGATAAEAAGMGAGVAGGAASMGAGMAAVPGASVHQAAGSAAASAGTQAAAGAAGEAASGGVADQISEALSGGLDADTLLKILDFANAGFQSNRNDQTQKELMKMYEPFRNESFGHISRLRDTYDHPERYLQSPEYQAIQKTVHESLGRADAAKGLNANSLGRQAKLQELAMGNLANYRQGLQQNIQTLGGIGTGQGAYNALESRNNTYAPLQSALGSLGG